MGKRERTKRRQWKTSHPCSECGETAVEKLMVVASRQTLCSVCQRRKAMMEMLPPTYVETAPLMESPIEQRKHYYNWWKLTHPCIDCGETDPNKLTFDHRNPIDKKRTIGRLYHRSWRTLLNEIAKCDVRCQRCHTIHDRPLCNRYVSSMIRLQRSR